ncbi:MAG: HaeIII family restriction endonuclease [Gemmatimonadetes bacterium]|nr:HaeIII family restriction endonuclease [Gemmatimonadota bacterium]
MDDKDSKPAKGKQVQHGKAFEYCVAVELAQAAQAELDDTEAVANCRKHYDSLAESSKSEDIQARMQLAARGGAKFLQKHEHRNMKKANLVKIQPDAAGKKGDVRDILLCHEQTILFGISAKHKHHGVKHSRLSATNDFGQKWSGFAVSDKYWSDVRKIFGTLKQLKKESNNTALFKEIENVKQTVYLPIIIAFEDELKRLIENHGKQFSRNMFHYLIGKNDFYKLVQINKRAGSITSFNLNGSLAWGKKWSMPMGIENIKRNGFNKLIVTFDGGWTLSFRLHSGDGPVVPTLKFDVNFIGMAAGIMSHTFSFAP